MGDTVNLNRIRKAVARVKKRQQADENAVKYGRSKAERVLEATKNARARVKLDAHRREEE